jgi:tetratricopeptide (TPR) repeat protein
MIEREMESCRSAMARLNNELGIKREAIYRIANTMPDGQKTPYYEREYGIARREIEGNIAPYEAQLLKLEEELKNHSSASVGIQLTQEKVLQVSTQKPKKTVHPSSTTESLTKRGYIFLEDAEWERAADYFDYALDLDPEYVSAYVGLLCADLKVKSEEKLANQKISLENNLNYKKAIRFASEDYRAKLENYDVLICTRIGEKMHEIAKRTANKKANADVKTMTARQIMELTPRTNCNECGFDRCTNFALKVKSGEATLSECLYFNKR